MKLLARLPSFSQLCPLLFLISLLFLACMPVSATEIPGLPGTSSSAGGDLSGGVIDRYAGYHVADAPTVGMGLFPTVVLTEEAEPASQATAKPASSNALWLTISPFSGALNGQDTYLIAGYLSGQRTGASLSIARKAPNESDFEELETIKPDDTGLFVWLVPAEKAHGLFRATASSGSDSVVSNGIRFFADNVTGQGTKPAISPVQAPSSLPDLKKSTSVSADSGKKSTKSSVPALTTMSISSVTLTPVVGDELVISGRLTDSDGNGVEGATIKLDETGYPGAQQSEPLLSTQSDSDGRFEFAVTVKFANIVGLFAHYDGDDTHTGSESNTLTFSSRAA
jgi:hypothetical protein